MSDSRTTNDLARLAARQKLAVLGAASTLITATFVTSIGVASYASVNDYRRPGPVTLSEVVAVLGLVLALLFICGSAVLWRRRKRRFVVCVRQLREHSEAEASQIATVPLRVLLTPAGAGRAWLLYTMLTALLFLLVLASVLFLVSFRIAFVKAHLGPYSPLVQVLPILCVLLIRYARGRWQSAIDEVLRRGSRATCLSCGYPREGLPWESPCPECGTPHSIARFHYINAFWGSPFR